MNPIGYDAEFLENGVTIDLMSIGLVAASGDEYYAVCADDQLICRAAQTPWMVDNVLSSLPIRMQRDGSTLAVDTSGSPFHRVVWWDWDTGHPDFQHVKPRRLIAREVKQFIRSYPAPQLWADFGAYDHVVLCQLFGPMTALPEGIPMFTCDIRQEAARLGDPKLPEQESGAHNALADARHVIRQLEFMRHLDLYRTESSW